MSNNYEDQRESLLEAGQLESLHRPLAGEGMFKGGLQQPDKVVSETTRRYGWICAKCGTGNAPARMTCARCTVPYA